MENLMQHKIDFIDHARFVIDYWAKQPGLTEQQRLEGVVFSILVAIDGEAVDIGPYMLKPTKEGGKWGPDIGGDLHNLFYKLKKSAASKVKLPPRLIIAIDEAGLHIRKTVCVEHNDVTDIATYDAKRMFSINNPELRSQVLSMIRKNYIPSKAPKAKKQNRKTAKKKHSVTKS